jgi:uncharacterized membrane protein (TIGR02234 family)
VTGAKGLRTAVVLCLAGAFVVLVAAGRTWVEVAVPASPLADAGTESYAGTELVPGLTALGLLGLAAVVALAATRSRGRTLVGVVLLATGAGVIAAALSVLGRAFEETLPGQELGDTVADLSGWFVVTAVGGILLFAAGAQTVPYGRTWPELGQRYEAPTGSGPVAAAQPAEQLTDKGLWEALDRGEDPTANLGSPARPPADREADRT